MICGTRSYRRFTSFALLPVLLLVHAAAALDPRDDGAPQDGPAPIDVQADDYVFDTATGWATGSGNVSITYQDLVLEADEVRVNMQTRDVEATGDIYFYRVMRPGTPAEDTVFWRGSELTGNFETGVFETGAHQVTVGPWYQTGDTAIYRHTGEIVFHNVSISTCEYLHTGNAHYSISADRVVYTAAGRLRAWNAVYRVGRLPVMWWPYVYWDTDRDGGNLSIEPGYDGDWGAFLLLGRSWKVGETGETRASIELRSKRGVALRSHTRFETEASVTDLLLYGMRDQDPPETEPDFNRRFDVQRDRYRVKAYHRHEWLDNLSLRLNLDVLSDIDMLEEWFEDEFEAAPQPRSFADLRLDRERFTLSLAVRPRVNDFYTAVERLPELKATFPLQTTFVPGLLYAGETSAARLRMRWREFDRDPVGGGVTPDDYDAWRLDSLHMFYYPLNLGGKLQVVPRAGLRATYYDTTSATAVTAADWRDMAEADDPDRITAPAALTQYDDDGGSAWRMTGELGVEMSTKLTRIWNDARSDFWRIDGLRHVIQPYANYTYIPKPTEDRENLYFFDYIDRLTEMNFIRVGVNQRLQTRNPEGDGIHTLASLDTYADFHFETPYGHDTLGQIGARARVQPRRDLDLWASLVASMDDGRVRWSEAGARFRTVFDAAVALAYIYRDDRARDSLLTMGTPLLTLGTEDLAVLALAKTHYLTLSLDVPLGDKMAGRVLFEYDLDEKDLARQMYQVSRDLHCWVGALRLEEEDGVVTAKAILYLKAFPSINSTAGM